MKTEDSIEGLEQQPLDETKPGLCQHYCIPCAKYFETQSAKSHHQRGKVHKRRVKMLKEGPYTHEEANAAAGHDVAKYMAKKEQGKVLTEGQSVQQVLAKPHRKQQEIESSSTSTIDGEVKADDAMQIEDHA